MYDSDALQSANDRLWAAIAGHLGAAGLDRIPTRLDRSRPLADIWDDPDLLLAQTCGYPLMTQWRAKLRYVATPCYRAPGCDGVAHRSRIVVRRDDDAETLGGFRGRKAALNDPHSNTGMNLLRAIVAPLAEAGTFFGAVIDTGSHAASARAVADGAADIAAIDTVTFAHLELEAPDITKRLRTLAWTTDTPGLPFVTAAATSPGIARTLYRAIDLAVRDERAAADLLLLDRVEHIGLRPYQRVKTLEMRSRRAGYPTLA
jgi:ABC-type phosphate/phosphonate transport system substrate-binding protein